MIMATTRHRSPLRRLLAAAALTAAAGFAIDAAWIPIKAEVAQVLLKRAWHQAGNGGADAKPWPWADTWPVARLRMPERDVDLIVLAGATGRTLAFGPGHLGGTAAPGDPGNCVLSAHRDTHFSFLRYVLPGEELTLETPDGRTRVFRVTARHIVYDRDGSGPGRHRRNHSHTPDLLPLRQRRPGRTSALRRAGRTGRSVARSCTLHREAISRSPTGNRLRIPPQSALDTARRGRRRRRVPRRGRLVARHFASDQLDQAGPLDVPERPE